MTDAPWQILVVDDEAVFCDQVKRFLEAENLDDSVRIVQVTTTQSFETALEHLESKKIDAVVLDVRNQSGSAADDDAGVVTLSEIKKRRFVPVVFYTGLPSSVAHMRSEVIHVVEKTGDLEEIKTALRQIVGTGIPAANRAIIRHVEHVQRDFMWDSHEILSANRESTDKLSIAYLMARRLAMSLQRTGIEDLAREMGDTQSHNLNDEHVHPMFFYIIPAIPDSINTGGVYKDQSLLNSFWVVLTNACDLDLKDVKDNTTVPPTIKKSRKAERILLAACLPLKDQPEYVNWKGKPTDKSIRNLIGNNRSSGQAERYFFLPAGLEFNDMLVDFQHLRSVTADDIEKMESFAIIDSPFVESLISKFTRFYARVGTPDLDSEIVLNRIT